MSRLAEQFESANVANRQGVNLGLGVLDEERRVQENVAVRVGIAGGGEVDTHWQVRPAPRLQLLRRSHG